MSEYLKKPCPKCRKKTLREDSDGDGVYYRHSAWIYCDSCEEDFDHKECGYEYNGMLPCTPTKP